MSPSPVNEATRLLHRLEAGDSTAGDRLLELLYDEMHRMAALSMRKERAHHTLQPTALVNEVWMRLMGGGDDFEWRSRSHFLCTVATAMRRVLVDHARKSQSSKRDAGRERITIHDALASYDDRGVDLIGLDEALERLAQKDAELARLVELRFFAGLTTEETARALDLSVRQVEGAWVTARGWLRRELRAPEA